MNDTILQAVIWIGAGATLFIFLRRRKARRQQ